MENKKEVKNIIEMSTGNLDCLMLFNGAWGRSIMTKDADYIISEDLGSDDWTDIKPCPQSEKDAHEAEQESQEALAYLSSTDWYVMRSADSGEPMPEEIKQARADARLRVI